jgi:hypothetical protein
MTKPEVKKLQKELNAFTNRWLEKFPPIMVDGDKGHATNTRIRTAKYYLGYTGKPQRSSSVSPVFRKRLLHPKNDAIPARMRARGEERRRAQHKKVANPSGVTTFDGRPVARWMVKYLEFARARGWRGTLNSGYRDPEFSEQLCERMCGQPSCPGRCAGRNSNHAGKVAPKGAIDVSDYTKFGQLMARSDAPDPRIFNGLGAQDPVHFSVSGR